MHACIIMLCIALLMLVLNTSMCYCHQYNTLVCAKYLYTHYVCYIYTQNMCYLSCAILYM